MADYATNPNVRPENLPIPQDDGAAIHLKGMRLPDVVLPATDGSHINLSKIGGRTVIYIYPRTGVPGVPNPDGWDQIRVRAVAHRNLAHSAIISAS